MSTTTDFAAEALQIGPAELNRLVATLRGLSPDAWRRPTACAEWDVSALVAHVGMLTPFFTRTIEQRTSGAVPDLMAMRREQRARTPAIATQPPAELLAWLDEVWHDLYRRTLTPLEPTEYHLRAWHPMGSWPVERFLGMAVFELAIHHWDVRAPVDPAATLDAEVARLLVTFIGRWPDLLVRNRTLECGQVTVAFAFGAAAPPLAIGVDGQGRLVAGEGRPDATITTDPATFVLVTTGRLGRDQAGAAGRWHVAGDAAAGERLFSCFVGI